MDSYSQVGPDKPGYADDVKVIRDHLILGTPVVVKFTANSTAKHVVLTPWDTCSQMSRPPGFGGTAGDPLMVAIDGGQAAFLPTRDWLHPAYVGQYLGHSWGWHDTSDVGDEPFARFLNDVLGHVYPPAILAGDS